MILVYSSVNDVLFLLPKIFNFQEAVNNKIFVEHQCSLRKKILSKANF